MSRAVVVGSGPNGLAAAITLAASGVEVTVLEANDRVGGGTRSSELTVAGLIHDECSGFHPLAVRSAFARFAGLEQHGLAWCHQDIEYASPLDNGEGAAAFRSIAETAVALGVDGARWQSLFGPLDARFDDITEDFLQPVVRAPGHPLSLGRFGLRAGLPVSVLARRFSTEAGRALLAGVAAHAMWPFRSVLSSAIGVALGAAAHRYGWPVAKGGSQSIASAMVAVLESHGGQVETGLSVNSIKDLGSNDMVLLDVAPSAAVQILGDLMPARMHRALTSYRHGPGAFKVDFAVEGGVPWQHELSLRAGTVHVGGTYAEIAEAEAAVHRGELPERPFVLVGQQYLADPSRSKGNLHPVYSYAHVPAGFDGDVTADIEEQIERFAPGFRERIVGRCVQSTADLARRNPNYVGGDILTGANSPRQLVFRPRVGMDPYSLGLPGVYLCSAATPPGAGAHGMCGFNAARCALRDAGLPLPDSG